ncbi:MAG TPA: NAD(+) diphosphatase [Steroidobacteraceae bacterium]|jgi:NAD+ diphosphatase|nr:NAD(+) diphosphatase [Steroidobacteraceae bacterium]
MPSSSPPFDPGAHLQRRTEERSRPDWLQAAQADPQTRYLAARATAHLIRPGPEARIAFVGREELAALAQDESQQVLLGWFRGQRCVLLDLPPETAFQPDGTVYEELRPLLPQVPEDEAHLLTYARALLIWRSRHRHCGVCGAPTRPRNAGHVIVCTVCGTQVFPRIDPAIIVLVTDGTRALLGRQPSWPQGRYSTLAGFVEAGESLEDAVAREVHEETGAVVQSVRYFASQPWPFPASLMLGFHAHATQSEIKLDGELEDARWFDLAELRAGRAALLPPPHTIARRLLEAWFQSGEDRQST